MRFWSQFELEIDKSKLKPVETFSYLKEMVVPKVRTMIDWLPFTAEGYNRTKSILIAKFGKPSEVANVHIQTIISLPSINNTNPHGIHDFHETLVIHVNTLDTFGKLKEINGDVISL